MDTRLGTELAGYRIEAVLGRGGMGIVYLAEQRVPRRRVALKVLAPELSDDPGFRERFARESDAAASIDHPNVIPIYGAGEADGMLYIAMRYVEGSDLAELIRREGPLDPARVSAIVSQVAAALDAAHERGLVHRDVKPGNVLIARGPGSSEHAYLTDFGVIKRREVTSGITRTGQFMGSVDYVAPEQVRGEPVDGRADVYALGCVLFECLTGSPPFASDLEVTVLYAQLEEPPPPVTVRRPELPAGIDAVVSRAMAKRPEERFPTAGAMAAAAREVLGPGPDALPRGPEPPPRRGRLLAAGAVAVAVAAVIVASAMLLGRGGATTPAATQSSHTPVAPPAFAIVRIDPVTGRATAFAPPPGSDISYTGLVAGEGALWAASPNGVTHIDPRSGSVVKLIPTEDTPVNVAIGDGSVWAAGDPGDWHLWRIDPATDQQGGSINLIARGNFSTVQTVYRVSTGFGAVWVADQTCGCVLRVDPARARVRKVIGIGGADAIAAGGGGVWVVDNFHQELVRIDPRNNEVATRVPLELGSPDLVAVGMGAVWVADGGSGTLVEVDPSSNQVVSPPIGIGGVIADLAVGAGAVWVSHGRGEVARVDPVSYSVTSVRIPGPGVDRAGHLAIDEPNHLVWLTRCLPGSTVC